jgi:hypothetical protein
MGASFSTWVGKLHLSCVTRFHLYLQARWADPGQYGMHVTRLQSHSSRSLPVANSVAPCEGTTESTQPSGSAIIQGVQNLTVNGGNFSLSVTNMSPSDSERIHPRCEPVYLELTAFKAPTLWKFLTFSPSSTSGQCIRRISENGRQEL